MDTKISLKNLEKKAYLTYHGDGIWDICLGLWFASTAVFVLIDLGYMMGVFPAILLPGILGIKRSFNRPRLGYVQFSGERKERERRAKTRLAITLTVTCVAGLVVFWAFAGGSGSLNWIRGLGLVPFGAVIAVVLGVVGFSYGIYRFVIYGILALAVFIAGHLAHTHIAIIFFVPGIVCLAAGLILMTRFVRKYPRAKENISYVNTD